MKKKIKTTSRTLKEQHKKHSFISQFRVKTLKLSASFENFSAFKLIKAQKQCYIIYIEFINDFRGSVMISSSQKQGLVMIAVVVGLMTLPMMY